MGSPLGHKLIWLLAKKRTSSGRVVVSVPQTDTGRRGEYPKALERTLAQELGKMTP